MAEGLLPIDVLYFNVNLYRSWGVKADERFSGPTPNQELSFLESEPRYKDCATCHAPE